MLGRILGGFFWDFYDNLGQAIIGNIVAFLLSIPAFIVLLFCITVKLPPLLLLFSLGLAAALFSIPLIGLYHQAQRMVEQREIHLKHYWEGIRLFWKPALISTLVFYAVLALLAVNVYFYVQLKGGMRTPGLLLAGLTFWAAIFILISGQYLYPLIVQQNPGLKKLFTRMILLSLDNLGATLLTGITTLSVVMLTVLTVVGPVILSFTILAVHSQNLLFEVLDKYEKKETPPPPPPVEKPTSWHQIRNREKQIEAAKPKWRHDGRGWKDILRPWDM